jgi:hypothetical protein
MSKNRIWLCLGPTLLCLLDGCLTLYGQPAAYWQGSTHLAEELNPLGLWALERHPLCFTAVLLCWIGAFATIILSLPLGVAVACSFLIQLGHTVGAALWVIREFGWIACIPLLLASSVALEMTWKKAGIGRHYSSR